MDVTAPAPDVAFVSFNHHGILPLLSEFITVPHESLRAPAEILRASHERGGGLLLFSNFPHDGVWHEVVPRCEHGLVDRNVATRQPDLTVRFKADRKITLACTTYECSKNFYGQLLREFPRVELHVITCAARMHLADEEITELGVRPGQANVWRVDSTQRIWEHTGYVMRVLQQHGIAATSKFANRLN